ncbi:hypothetical protein [Amycolatopsis sp. Hca4]|uniref:hypothetical protein n=1 Tax=Amycolatopsis sp. Hca4 TaxID=2742131 RepID=UPI00158FD242|nr:hypothetical protein [Amycolatopsis sp. Hca4]QKV74132.1 hypothetical protein HUT10_10400 [Amycolatopsis sp. Hca4]
MAPEVRRIRPTGSAAASWLDDLGRGKPGALRHLRRSLHLYFKALVEPYLQVVDQGLRTECAAGIQRYLRTGPEGLLGRLGPDVHWQWPILTVGYPVDRDLHLDGRGLLLIPGYFYLYHPVALADPRLRPVLVFPLRDR